MKQAEIFAELFAGGQSWESFDGDSFEDLAERMGAIEEFANSDGKDDEGNDIYVAGYKGEWMAHMPIRYVFPDESCVVAIGDAWDFEGEALFSWRG